MGKSAASVAVLYSSDYGFSDRLSQTLARGITKTDTAVEMVDVLSVDSQVSPLTLAPTSMLCLEAHARTSLGWLHRPRPSVNSRRQGSAEHAVSSHHSLARACLARACLLMCIPGLAPTALAKVVSSAKQ